MADLELTATDADDAAVEADADVPPGTTGEAVPRVRVVFEENAQLVFPAAEEAAAMETEKRPDDDDEGKQTPPEPPADDKDDDDLPPASDE